MRTGYGIVLALTVLARSRGLLFHIERLVDGSKLVVHVRRVGCVSVA